MWARWEPVQSVGRACRSMRTFDGICRRAYLPKRWHNFAAACECSEDSVQASLYELALMPWTIIFFVKSWKLSFLNFIIFTSFFYVFILPLRKQNHWEYLKNTSCRVRFWSRTESSVKMWKESKHFKNIFVFSFNLSQAVKFFFFWATRARLNWATSTHEMISFVLEPFVLVLELLPAMFLCEVLVAFRFVLSILPPLTGLASYQLLPPLLLLNINL